MELVPQSWRPPFAYLTASRAAARPPLARRPVKARGRMVFGAGHRELMRYQGRQALDCVRHAARALGPRREPAAPSASAAASRRAQ